MSEVTQKEKYKKLREEGWTFQAIADKFGISRQAIKQSLNYIYADGTSPRSTKR